MTLRHRHADRCNAWVGLNTEEHPAHALIKYSIYAQIQADKTDS